MNHQNRKEVFDDIFNQLFGFNTQGKPQAKPQANDELNQATADLTDALKANTEACNANTEAQPAPPDVDTHPYSGKKLEQGLNCVFSVFHWCVLKNLHNLEPTEFRYDDKDVKLTEKAALSYVQFCEVLK